MQCSRVPCSRLRFSILQLFAFLAVLVVDQGAMAAELTLRYVTETAVYDKFVSADEGIGLLTAEGRRLVPPEGEWDLAGDIDATNATSIVCAPAWALCRRAREGDDDGARPLSAVVVLVPQADAWPVDRLRQSIAVFAWVCDGRIAHVIPVPLRSFYLARGQIAASARFDLTESEMGGAPVVMVLHDNRWVGRAIQNGGGEVERAEYELVFAKTGAEEALERIKRAPRQGAERLMIAASSLADGGIAAKLLRAREDKPPRELVERMLRISVQAGRSEPLSTVLEFGGSVVAKKVLSDLVELAVSNGQDECAARLMSWMANHRIQVVGRERLAELALQRHLNNAFSLLAGAETQRIKLKLAEERFTAIARQGDRTLLRTLLDAGAKPARVDRNAVGLTMAAYCRDRELVAALLAAGAKPDPEDERAPAPLIFAARSGDANIVAILLKAGARVDRRNLVNAGTAYAAGHDFDIDYLPWPNGRTELNPPAGATIDALEVALGARERTIVGLLVAAGARLQNGAAERADMIENVIATDQPILLARVISTSVARDDSLAKGWRMADFALAYESRDCLALLQKQFGSRTGGVSFPPVIETPPTPLVIEIPEDVRRRDRAQPEVKVVLDGVVDPAGELRAVRIRGVADLELGMSLRRASAAFRFRPACSAGKAVCARIELPLVLPKTRARLVKMADLDLPPLRPDERTGPMPFSEGALVAGFAVSVPDYFEHLRSGMNDGSRDYDGEKMPLVTFVVDEHGRPTDATVLWAPDRIAARSALKNLSRYTYLPGILGGRPVAVPLTIRVPGR